MAFKPLKWCVNGDGRPVSPPSKVICRECQDAITAKLDAMIARLDEREKEAKASPSPPKE